MQCFIILDGILIKKYSPSPSAYFEPLLVSDGKRVSYFLPIISKHTNGCYLISLSGLNRKLQIHKSYFRVICSKLLVQSSGCVVTSSFESAD